MEDIRQDRHIIFKESTHEYINSNTNDNYTSVTTIISKYFPKFVADENKTKYTRKKLQMTHEEVLELWENKKIYSCNRGSEIHYMLECIFNGIDYDINNIKYVSFNEMISYFNKGMEIYNNSKELYDFHPEELVWSDEYKIGGQVDLPIFDHNRKEITVVDHKSNDKELLYDNKYQPKMLHPFNNSGLGTGDLTKYGLQLSIYSILLEQKYEGYKVIGNIIWTFRNSEFNTIVLDMNKFRPFAEQIIKLNKYEV